MCLLFKPSFVCIAPPKTYVQYMHRSIVICQRDVILSTSIYNNYIMDDKYLSKITEDGKELYKNETFTAGKKSH